MKKLFSIILCAIFIAACATVLVGAETLTFTFDSAEKVDEWVDNYNKTCTEYSFDAANGFFKVTNTGHDPYIEHKFDTPLDGDRYNYVVYRYKIIEGLDNLADGQFFFTSDKVKAGNEGSYTRFSNQKTSEWQEVVFDLSSLNWGGKVSMFRFDHVDGPSEPVTVLVHSITFTTTREEAFAYADSFKSNAESDSPAWILDNYEIIDRFAPTIDQMYSTFTNGEWLLESSGGDPKITFSLNDREKVRCESYRYVALRMKTTSYVNTAGFFFKTSSHPSLDASYSQFDLKNTTGEWAEYIIDMTAFDHGCWEGTLNSIRLDPINPGETGAKFQIDRFGIFRTEAEAQEFLDKEVKLNIVKPEEKQEDVESEIINTGAKTTKWDLRTAEDSAKWTAEGAQLKNELGFLTLYADTTDAQFICDFSEDEYFDAKEFHYFAMRYKAKSTGTSSGFFFTNQTYTSYDDKTFTTFQIDSRGEWQNIIIDMNEANTAAHWNGTITSIRLDPLNPSPIGTEFTMARAGFFRSIKEANEFLNGGNDEEDYSRGTEFTADFQQVIVPDGALYAGYDSKEYMLTNANGENIPDNAVISFVDKDGTESIVALGNVNSAGCAKYIARKPGTYSISSYSKNYIDTADHWGKEYIDYVSSRKLFGGTSETEFSPEDAMTRGMFITVLGRMHGLDTAAYDGNTGYADVNPTEYYAPYIQWAKEYSILAPLSEASFGAEEPISRKDMALAIANYVNAYNYSLAVIANAAEFTDIAALTDAEKSAIADVQASGIINGKGAGIFDPYGVSTRAEVATVMQRTIKAILGITVVQSQYDSTYFDRDKIHLGVWTFSDRLADENGIKQLAELGANLIVSLDGTWTIEKQNSLLNLTDTYGIEVYTKGITVNEHSYKNGVNYKSEAAYYLEHPSFGGHYFADEPGTDSFGWMGDMANEYEASVPGKRAFVNLLPMYANAAQLKMGAGAAAIKYYDSDPELYRKYCEAWFENFDTDYICTDIYPLNWTDSKKYTQAKYVEYINIIASVARENDAEFWCCIQTFGWNNNKRTPNEAEYRWQCYSMLSFGCTGILLWNYSGTSVFPSLVHPITLQSTDAYNDCKPVMWEMRAISDVFVQYKNLGAFTVNRTAATPYLEMSGEYKDFNTLASITSNDPLLVGCFTAKEGDGKAFTITNMLDFEGNEAKKTTVTFTLDDMSKTVTSYYRGEPTVLTAQNGAYSIELECGDGVFITVA